MPLQSIVLPEALKVSDEFQSRLDAINRVCQELPGRFRDLEPEVWMSKVDALKKPNAASIRKLQEQLFDESLQTLDDAISTAQDYSAACRDLADLVREQTPKSHDALEREIAKAMAQLEKAGLHSGGDAASEAKRRAAALQTEKCRKLHAAWSEIKIYPGRVTKLRVEADQTAELHKQERADLIRKFARNLFGDQPAVKEAKPRLSMSGTPIPAAAGS